MTDFIPYQTEAKIIADSIDKNSGVRLTSIQLTFPRFILPELNKHRIFSNNAASSRAIPVSKMIDRVVNNPVIPVHWGANQPGMVATEEIEPALIKHAESHWIYASQKAVEAAKALQEMGVHKQVVNRLLEPFSWTHVIVSSTDYSNFFSLRIADDAQPEMRLLAEKMKEAMDNSIPTESLYHLPYIRPEELEEFGDKKKLYEQYALISAARCARVSYNKHDGTQTTVDEDLKLANRLKEQRHDVCFEHQAVSAKSHKTASGNFRGWIQYRSTFPALNLAHDNIRGE